MKLFFTYCLIILFVSCDSSEKKDPEDSSEKTESNATSKEEKSTVKGDGLSLEQHGDYSTLFNLEKGDCSFIGVNDISNALSLSEDAIQDISGYGSCNYEITLEDASKWTVSLQWHAFPKDQITKEIKSYTDEGSPLTALISKTKDTYLCIHPFNKFLMLYNNNYDGAIQISYCKITDCRKLSEEQKETRKQLAITLGDYLLQKHKK
jgi:hypothetical protein